MKSKFTSLKNRFHKIADKKGLNSIEATIIIIIILMCIMTMLDLMEVTQKMSATTSATTYITKLVGRQGGITNAVPDDFESYGHGSYITTQAAYDIMNTSLRKAFSVTDGSSVLGNQVKIYITPYKLGDTSWERQSTIEFTDTTEFGVYVEGSLSSADSPLLIRQKDILFHQVYYLVTVEMYYDAFTVQKLLTFSDSYFTRDESILRYKKTFSRFIIPTYYNRAYVIGSDEYQNDSGNEEWFVQ